MKYSAAAVAAPTVIASERTSAKARGEDRRDPDELGEVQPREEARDEVDRAHRQRQRVERAAFDACDVRPPEAERPHRPGAGDGIQQLLGAGRRRAPLGGVDGGGAAEVPAQRVGLDRDGEQPGQREAPVQRGEPDDGERDDQRRAGHPGQRLADGLGDLRDVVADARDEVAAAGALDALQRQRQHALDDALAQVGERALAEAGDERLADGGQPALDDRGEQQQDGGPGEIGIRALLDDEVDDVAEQGGDGEPGRGRDEQRGAGREHEPARPGQRERGAAGLRRGRDRQRFVGAALTRAPPRGSATRRA